MIIGFEQHRPGYGVQGLLDDLARRPPRLVALQARDWDPDGPNSLDFFRAEPRLRRGSTRTTSQRVRSTTFTCGRGQARVSDARDLSGRQFWYGLLLILVAAALLRVAFLTADPPWQTPVGITWHDEGPWVHNARNKALFGHWSLDQWNPDVSVAGLHRT